MHLLRDENGNLIPHGSEHSHSHTHEDGTVHAHEHHHHDGEEGTHEHTHCASADHCHSNNCNSCHDPEKEAIALLTYMLQHNEAHAAELDQMATNIEKLGANGAAKTIREAVTDFQKGNLRLSLALTLVKEELKK